MKEFYKFKKKVLTETIIKGLLYSFALFFISFGVLLILTKREIIAFPIWASVLSCLGASCLLFLLVFILKKPNDTSVAVRLDKTFNLDEKVQTMIELKDETGVIIDIQRNDTLRRLGSINAKQLGLKINKAIYFVITLGLLIFTASFVVPSVYHEIIDPEPEFSLTEWQILQIEKLIDYVDSTKMKDNMKSSYNNELRSLVTSLEESTKEAQMKANVLTAITNINLKMMQENTNKLLYSTLKDIRGYNIISDTETTDYQLKSGDSVTILADNSTASTVKLVFIPYNVIENGVEITIDHPSILQEVLANEKYEQEHILTVEYDGGYNLVLGSKTTALEITKISNYTLLGEAAFDYSSRAINEVILSIQRKYLEGYEKSPSATTFMLKSDISALRTSLENTSISSDDPFYIALNKYADDLELALNGSAFKISDNIKAALDYLEPVLVEQITLKLENRNVAWYVEDELRKIFDLPASENREEDKSEEGSSASNGDQTNNNTDFNGPGGLGEGDFIFSSTDLIYDFEKNELVPYGELYDNYYAIINGLINEGQLTEEMVAYIKDYYSSLIKVNNQEGE